MHRINTISNISAITECYCIKKIIQNKNRVHRVQRRSLRGYNWRHAIANKTIKTWITIIKALEGENASLPWPCAMVTNTPLLLYPFFFSLDRSNVDTLLYGHTQHTHIYVHTYSKVNVVLNLLDMRTSVSFNVN